MSSSGGVIFTFVVGCSFSLNGNGWAVTIINRFFPTIKLESESHLTIDKGGDLTVGAY